MERQDDNKLLISLNSSSLIRTKNSIEITQKILLEKVARDHSLAEYYYKRAQNKFHHDITVLEDYTKAIELDPSYHLPYERRANAKIRFQMDYEGAIEDYTKFLEFEPKNRIFIERGKAKKILKEFYGSIEDFTTSIIIEPHWLAYIYRGAVKEILKDYEGALADYTQATIIRNGESRDLRVYIETIEFTTTAIEFNPKDSISYYNRGLAKSNLGNYDGAIDDFTSAIKIKPDYSIAYFNRAIAKRKNFTTEYNMEIIEDYNIAIELDSSNSTAFANRGYEKANSRVSLFNPTAIEDCNRAIEIDPNNSTAYIRRASVLLIFSKYSQAEADIKKAVEIDPLNESEEIDKLWDSLPTPIEHQYHPPTDEECQENKRFLDSLSDDEYYDSFENAD